MLLLCFSLLLGRFYISHAGWVPWTGIHCHTSSNSSYLESKLLDRHHIRIPHIHLLSNCFYWITGSLNLDLSTSRHNVSHYCIATTSKNDSAARTVYRSLTQNFLRYTNESIIYRSAYGCKEELPHGYQNEHSLPHLPAQWYSRQEFYFHLKGKRLLLLGNSLTRQVFQRIIMYVRGMLSFVEHFAHRDMIYGFDDKVDYWEICDFEQMAGKCSGSSSFWSHFRDPASVALINFGFSQFIDFSGSENLYITSNKNFQLVGIVKQFGFDFPHWIFFNVKLHEELDLPLHLWSDRHQRALPHWASRNGLIFDIDSIAVIDDAHFQCGAEPAFGLSIVRVKTPKTLDCSDSFNLNVIQRLFMFLFDERKY